ncbi:MAG: peptide ABC transporter substrate-binding protein [Oscillospiraceae bacterium]|jgi:oligopeptide transport system substrate-binding protein|nr:peptide ABC transporter substrate-binding protein [Oscillospiraceae bacterium]
MTTRSCARRVLSFCLAAALLLPLASCQKKTGKDKEFAYPIDAAPECLDPPIAQGDSALLVLTNCFEGLVRAQGPLIPASDEASAGGATASAASQTTSARETILPGAAFRWEISPDGLVYTFYLRRDSEWHLLKDAEELLGTEAYTAFNRHVRAQDFVFAFRRALDPVTGAPNAPLLYPIQGARQIHEGRQPTEALGAEALDDFTLRITLEEPSSGFLSALTQPVAFPCNQAFFEATKGRYGLTVEYLLCNGPFYLSRWEPGNLRLRRHDGYRGEWEVSPSAVNFPVQPDLSEQLRLLRAENGYAAMLIPADGTGQPGELAQAAQADGAMVTALQTATLALLFRCETLPLSIPSLRGALCAAIQPEHLNLTALEGFLPAACQVGGASFRQLAGPARGIQPDQKRAKLLWEEAMAALRTETGQTEPKVALTLLCLSENERDMRTLLQDWQNRFGLPLQISIEAVPAEELARRVRNGEYDIALAPVRAGSQAMDFLQNFAGSGGQENLTGYRSAVMDGLLQNIAEHGDQTETARGCLAAEEHLLQNGVIYPLRPLESYLLTAAGVSWLALSSAGDVLRFQQAEWLK